MSIIEFSAALSNAQSKWIDQKIDLLLREGVPIDLIDIQMRQNCEVRIFTFGSERFRWKPNFKTQ